MNYPPGYEDLDSYPHPLIAVVCVDPAHDEPWYCGFFGEYPKTGWALLPPRRTNSTLWTADLQTVVDGRLRFNFRCQRCNTTVPVANADALYGHLSDVLGKLVDDGVSLLPLTVLRAKLS